MKANAHFSGPWMPWYHGDFLASTQGWSIAERGTYMMLLGASWMMGPLPDDRRRLAGIVGAQLDEFDEAWAVVKQKFDLTEEGLVNRRLEEHRETQRQRSESARKSAKKRWESDGDANAYANADANACPVADANGDASAMLETVRETMRIECSSELRTQNAEDQSSEPKSPRARARSGVVEPSKLHQEIIDAYHDVCPDLPKIKIWTPERRKALDDRIRDQLSRGKPADTVQYWRKIFSEQVAASDWLCGRTTSFRANLEWILHEDNFPKVIEDHYQNRTPTNGVRAYG